MAIMYSDKAKGVSPAADSNAATLQPLQGTVPAITCVHDAQTATVEAKVTLTSLAANDIIVALPLPAGHVPVDLYVTSDDLDTANTVTLTVAQLLQDFSDVVAAAASDFLTASTIGQAGGVARATVVAGLRLAASTQDRWIGVKVVAGGTLNGSPVLTVVMSYRASSGD